MYDQNSFSDGNNRHWNYLGMTIFNREEDKLFVPLSPRLFRRLLLTATQQFREAMFTGNQEFTALYHFDPDDETGDTDPNSIRASVTLSFSYKYMELTRSGDDILIITPLHNADLIYNNPFIIGYNLELRLPIYATVTVDPYIGGDLGVDTFMYYRWTDNPDATKQEQILRIRIDQNPVQGIPAAPEEPPVWRSLGRINVTHLHADLMKELWFWDLMEVNEFVGSIPSSELKVKFVEGNGVRAANVYTKGGLLHGLQVKLKQYGNGCELVQLFVDEEQYVCVCIANDLMESNPDFKYRELQVFYRWKDNTALELIVQ